MIDFQGDLANLLAILAHARYEKTMAGGRRRALLLLSKLIQVMLRYFNSRIFNVCKYASIKQTRQEPHLCPEFERPGYEGACL